MEDIISSITEFENTKANHIMPNRIILPGVVVRYLEGLGYETEEQIMDLIKDIIRKTDS
jgi:hypothetical protein